MKLKNTPRILQNLVTQLKVLKRDSVITKEAEKQIQFLDMNMLKVISLVDVVDEALKVAIIYSSNREHMQQVYTDFLDIKNFIKGTSVMSDNKFLSPYSTKDELLALID